MNRILTSNGVVVLNVFIPVDGKIELGKACESSRERSARFFNVAKTTDSPHISGAWSWEGPTSEHKYPIIIFSGIVRGAAGPGERNRARDLLDSMLRHLARNVITVDFKSGPMSVHYGDETYSLPQEAALADA